MGLLSLLVLGFVSCGKPGETASPLDKKSAGESDAGASLTSGTPDPSVWPLGRLASYVIDIKCDKGVVATINGANSKPNSIVLPKDAGKCLGILKSIKLGQRFYTPMRDVTDSDFAEGGKVEFVEKSDASDIMGIVVEKQIAASGTGAGSMVFRFTGITERRSIGKINNVNNFSVRSIFISSDGQTAKGVMNFYSSGGSLRMLGCRVGKFFLVSGNLGISSEIMDLSKLSDDGLKTLMNSPALLLNVINSRDPGCGESFVASLPAIERMTMVVKNFEILSVKTTTINVGYSGVPSPTPGPQIAVEPSIPPQSAPNPGPVAAPVFGLRSGTYDSPQKITISSPTPDAIIYYTTDGSTPTKSSSFYSGAIDISSTSTIKAFAAKANFYDSMVVVSNYVINVGKPVSPCATDQAIIDPNETYSWRGVLRAGDDIQPFINGFMKYTLVNVGALHNDPDTVNFVCKLNGFAGGAVTAAGAFNSPGNNNIYRWVAGNNVLVPANAVSDNNTIKGYLCTGKLQDICKQDPSWIFSPVVPVPPLPTRL